MACARGVWPASILVACLVATAPAAQAESFFDRFFDPRDGMLDMSENLATRTGFLPVPIIISDPVVDYGGGLGIAFFHEQDEEEGADREPPLDIYGDPMLSLPPSVSAVAGAGTANGSWMGAGGHLGIFNEDTLRYLGIVGGTSINLNFHGAGDDDLLDGRPIGFNAEGFFTSHELKHRLWDTPVFLGGRYEFIGADIAFDDPDRIFESDDLRFNERTAGMTALLQIDERDNIFSPTAGHDTKLEIAWWGEAWGGNSDYWRARLRSTSYWDLLDDLNLGVKLDAEATGGEVPFYHLPFIRLRGIGSLRYQDEIVVSSEGELRYDLNNCWQLIGFGGVGITGGTDRTSGVIEGAGGGGSRYLVARRLGIRAGLDIAQGPEDTVVYVTVGSAWAR